MLRRRRLLAALFAAVAVLLGLRSVTAEPPPSRLVVVAARDLPAGAVLAAGDLRETSFAPGSVPPRAALDPAEVAGEQLASPVRAGEPITDVRVHGAGLVESAPGRATLPVRFPDAGMVDLLRVGDVIDVWATDPRGRSSRRITAGSVVLAVPPSGSGTGSGTGTVDPLAGRLVLLATAEAEIATVSRSAVGRTLTYVWSR